ncbi:hypothetical protein niasHT_031765 [Heterodera trifolii]|uniref:Uncharacterized protein n=1 Tax=Heterodera trifolii TaxID=157864 RepID=A0ABD2IPR2_9BILA
MRGAPPGSEERSIQINVPANSKIELIGPLKCKIILLVLSAFIMIHSVGAKELPSALIHLPSRGPSSLKMREAPMNQIFLHGFGGDVHPGSEEEAVNHRPMSAVDGDASFRMKGANMSHPFLCAYGMNQGHKIVSSALWRQLYKEEGKEQNVTCLSLFLPLLSTEFRSTMDIAKLLDESEEFVQQQQQHNQQQQQQQQQQKQPVVRFVKIDEESDDEALQIDISESEPEEEDDDDEEEAAAALEAAVATAAPSPVVQEAKKPRIQGPVKAPKTKRVAAAEGPFVKRARIGAPPSAQNPRCNKCGLLGHLSGDEARCPKTNALVKAEMDRKKAAAFAKRAEATMECSAPPIIPLPVKGGGPARAAKAGGVAAGAARPGVQLPMETSAHCGGIATTRKTRRRRIDEGISQGAQIGQMHVESTRKLGEVLKANEQERADRNALEHRQAAAFMQSLRLKISVLRRELSSPPGVSPLATERVEIGGQHGGQPGEPHGGQPGEPLGGPPGGPLGGKK